MLRTPDDLPPQKPRTGPQDSYITSPPQAPRLPAWIEVTPGKWMRTTQALPIARAVLMAGFVALKEQIPSAHRTIYNLERSCFHLKRVRVAPLTPKPPAA